MRVFENEAGMVFFHMSLEALAGGSCYQSHFSLLQRPCRLVLVCRPLQAACLSGLRLSCLGLGEGSSFHFSRAVVLPLRGS